MIAWKPVKGRGWKQAKDCQQHAAEAELEAEAKAACTLERSKQ
jgi:hypothetical protein